MRTHHTDITPRQCVHGNQHITCSNCRLSHLCLPISLELDEFNRFDKIVKHSKPLNKGNYLYRAGDPFRSIFAVNIGCIKAVSITQEGDEQITGFYLPGEILGLDGLDANYHCNSAIALETSATCQILFNQLENLSRKIPSLQRHYFQLMSREIISEQKLITLLSKGSAEQRIASLLMNLSIRHQRRQLSSTDFILPMSRTDMGNYLGLTIETVSRVLSRFQKEQFLNIKRRMVTLLNISKLRFIAGL